MNRSRYLQKNSLPCDFAPTSLIVPDKANSRSNIVAAPLNAGLESRFGEEEKSESRVVERQQKEEITRPGTKAHDRLRKLLDCTKQFMDSRFCDSVSLHKQRSTQHELTDARNKKIKLMFNLLNGSAYRKHKNDDSISSPCTAQKSCSKAFHFEQSNTATKMKIEEDADFADRKMRTERKANLKNAELTGQEAGTSDRRTVSEFSAQKEPKVRLTHLNNLHFKIEDKSVDPRLCPKAASAKYHAGGSRRKVFDFDTSNAILEPGKGEEDSQLNMKNERQFCFSGKSKNKPLLLKSFCNRYGQQINAGSGQKDLKNGYSTKKGIVESATKNSEKDTLAEITTSGSNFLTNAQNLEKSSKALDRVESRFSLGIGFDELTHFKQKVSEIEQSGLDSFVGCQRLTFTQRVDKSSMNEIASPALKQDASSGGQTETKEVSCIAKVVIKKRTLKRSENEFVNDKQSVSESLMNAGVRDVSLVKQMSVSSNRQSPNEGQKPITQAKYQLRLNNLTPPMIEYGQAPGTKSTLSVNCQQQAPRKDPCNEEVSETIHETFAPKTPNKQEKTALKNRYASKNLGTSVEPRESLPCFAQNDRFFKTDVNIDFKKSFADLNKRISEVSAQKAAFDTRVPNKTANGHSPIVEDFIGLNMSPVYNQNAVFPAAYAPIDSTGSGPQNHVEVADLVRNCNSQLTSFTFALLSMQRDFNQKLHLSHQFEECALRPSAPGNNSESQPGLLDLQARNAFLSTCLKNYTKLLNSNTKTHQELTIIMTKINSLLKLINAEDRRKDLCNPALQPSKEGASKNRQKLLKLVSNFHSVCVFLEVQDKAEIDSNFAKIQSILTNIAAAKPSRQTQNPRDDYHGFSTLDASPLGKAFAHQTQPNQSIANPVLLMIENIRNKHNLSEFESKNQGSLRADSTEFKRVSLLLHKRPDSSMTRTQLKNEAQTDSEPTRRRNDSNCSKVGRQLIEEVLAELRSKKEKVKKQQC